MAPVCDEGGQGAALDTVGEVFDGSAYYFVAAADCERLQGIREGCNRKSKTRE